jgi:hypothetical protein
MKALNNSKLSFLSQLISLRLDLIKKINVNFREKKLLRKLFFIHSNKSLKNWVTKRFISRNGIKNESINYAALCSEWKILLKNKEKLYDEIFY